MQAVNQFKQKQREAMQSLKNYYVNKLNNLKQAKRGLQGDYDKENFSTNLENQSRSNKNNFAESRPLRKVS